MTAEEIEHPGSRLKAVCYFAAFVGLGLVVASLGPTLPGLAERTRSHLDDAAVLFVVRQFGYFTGTVVGGHALDRWAGHPVLVGVLAAMATAMALAPATTLLWAAATTFGLVGVAEGMLDVGVNTLLVWEFRRGAGPFLNALHAAFGVGAFLSPVLVAQALSATGDVRWAYWTLALLLAPLPLLLARLPSPAPWHRTATESARRVDRRLVALITAFFFIYIGSEGGIGGWVYAYTVKTGIGDAAMGAYLTSGFWGALTIGRMLTIPAAVRFEPKSILAVALAGGIASMFVVLSAPGSLAAIWVGTLGAGLSLAAVFPTALSLAGRHMPVSGAVNSWFFGGASLGGMVLPWVIGQFFESVGPHVVFLFVAIDLAVTFVVLGAIALYLRSARKNFSGSEAAAS